MIEIVIRGAALAVAFGFRIFYAFRYSIDSDEPQPALVRSQALERGFSPFRNIDTESQP